MTATVLPFATSAKGRKKPVQATRRDADAWLKREHPELSRSARENLAAAVPTIQQAHPDLNVWEWLDSSARLVPFGFRAMTRGQNPTMRVGLKLARKEGLAAQFREVEREGLDR
jgi:hypothetical protein